jgi:hypothetical protein
MQGARLSMSRPNDNDIIQMLDCLSQHVDVGQTRGQTREGLIDLKREAAEMAQQLSEAACAPKPLETPSQQALPTPAQIGRLVGDMLKGTHRWTDNPGWPEHAENVGRAVTLALLSSRILLLDG